jgi:hypothetical protein
VIAATAVAEFLWALILFAAAAYCAVVLAVGVAVVTFEVGRGLWRLLAPAFPAVVVAGTVAGLAWRVG